MRAYSLKKHTLLAYALALFTCLSFAVLSLVSPVEAAPNMQINYQGKLTDSSNVAVPDGTYNMRFWLLTSSSIGTTSALWTESLTGTNRVQVTNGLFSVMLGSTSPLTSVDFNQTLYLGVEIGGTSTPGWDGEMSPRKILGAVPAAFEADRIDGLTSTQFVRTDATSTIATSSADTLLTITQNGAGDILNLFDGTSEVLTVLDGGNLGIGTTSPIARFTVSGNSYFGGNITGTGTLSVQGLSVSGSSTLGYASSTALTVSGNTVLGLFTGTNGTTTSLYTGTLGIGSDYITDITGTNLSITNGVLNVTSSADGMSNWLYQSGALRPSTTVGVVIAASSTIGNGTGAGGLTISGGATTTGNTYIGGNLSVGTSSRLYVAQLSGSTGNAVDPILQVLNYRTPAAADQNNSLELLSPNLVSDSGVYLALGKNASLNNRAAIEYRYQGDGSLSNAIRFGFYGNERLLNILASGNVGIGTSSPQYRLTVSTTTAGNTDLVGVAYAQGLNDGAGYAFNTAVTTVGALRQQRVGVGDYALQFHNWNGSSLSEMMTIRSSGNVGIGTTTPSEKLTIQGINRADVFYAASSTATSTFGEVNLAGITGSRDNWMYWGGTKFMNASSTGENLSIGLGAGIAMRSGARNTTIGDGAFALNTTGEDNVAVGYAALDANVSGFHNVAIGSGALGNSDSYDNVGVGRNALSANTSGLENVAIGMNTLSYNTTGNSNIALGRESGGDSFTESSPNRRSVIDNYMTFLGHKSSRFEGVASTTQLTYGTAIGAGARVGCSYCIALGGIGSSAVKVGIGTSTPTAKLTIHAYANETSRQLFTVASSTTSGTTTLFTIFNDGRTDMLTASSTYASTTNLTLFGSLYDGSESAGTNGMVLQTTGSGVQWVATSSLGISGTADGTSNWLYQSGALRPSTTVGVVIAASSTIGDGTGAGGLTILGNSTTTLSSIAGNFTATNQSASSTFGEINLAALNTATDNWMYWGGTKFMNASSTGNNLALGLNALASGTSSIAYNTAFGNEAMRYSTTSSFSTAVGRSALAQGQGISNTAVGAFSLSSTMSGYSNSALGANALGSNVSGFGNTAVGADTLLNSTGNFNTALGANALYSFISSAGTAVGRSAGYGDDQNTRSVSDFAPTFIGYNTSRDGSIASTTSLSNITALGYNAKVGCSNCLTLGGLGTDAVKVGIGTSTPTAKLTIHAYANETSRQLFTVASSTTSGTTTLFTIFNDGRTDMLTASSTYASTTNLTLFGSLYDGSESAGTNGMVLQTTGSGVQWVATSSLGLSAAGDGTSNWLYQSGALRPSTTVGLAVTASSTILNLTMENATTTNLLATSAFNVSAGGAYRYNGVDLARASTSLQNYFFGEGAGNFTATGTDNIGTGNSALSSLVGGLGNTAIGDDALAALTGGDYNTAIGSGALQLASNEVNSNVAVGHYSMWASSGSNNVALGAVALFDADGSDNIGIGLEAMRNASGNANIAIGTEALVTTTSGTQNVAVGDRSLFANVTGAYNTALGGRTLYYNRSATNTTAIGYEAGLGSDGNTASQNNVFLGYRSGYVNTTGSNNTLLGYQTGDTLTSGSNNILLGYDIDAPASTTSNFLSIGNLIFGRNIDGTGNTVSTGNIGIGTSSPWARLSVQGVLGSATPLLDIATTTSSSFATSSLFRVGHDGRVSIGSSTPDSKTLTIQRTGVAAGEVGGVKEYLSFLNTTSGGIVYGDNAYLLNSSTATTTLVGKIIRIEDSVALGNTVRGLEVQAHRGTNTFGENTALSGFGRTFGVRGATEGDAGAVFVPAGVFADLRGTTQGNALRAYSGTITTSNLVQLFHDGSTFSGTGLLMNFGNSGGSFAATSSAKFIDLKVAGTSKFTVTAAGTTTIGDGTTANMAGLQIGYGGLCVDNDGSCAASTTGRITSVSSASGNSDLAEMYFSSQDLLPGEIVALRGGLTVERATESGDLPILGVISTKPGVVMGYDDTSLIPGEVAHPVALKGRVPIRLSTENGPIAKGDRIMLSSIPGIGMKATESGMTVGIALEDFDGEHAYSEGYLNQFGDDLVKVRQKPRSKDVDPRAQDGCSYGGGGAQGESLCIKDKVASVKVETVSIDTRTEILEELEDESAETMTVDDREVAVGQVIMFVDLDHHMIASEATLLKELLGTTTLTNGNGTETLWDRIKQLAGNFVDGILSVTGLKTDSLCVGEVCVDEAQFLEMVQNANGGGSNGGDQTDEEPLQEDEDEGEDAEETEEDTETDTEEESGGEGEGAGEGSDIGDEEAGTEEVVEEETSEESASEEETSSNEADDSGDTADPPPDSGGGSGGGEGE